MTPRESIPLEWVRYLKASGPIGLGYDIATTTKGTSNWSALTVTQHRSPLYVQALVVRWKTADPEIALDMLDCVVSDIEGEGLRPRKLNVDSSNEKLFAARIKKHFAGRVPVGLISSGEKITWRGLDYNYKTLLGSLYVAAFEDNFMACPAGKWFLDDHRLAQKEGERFVVQLGKDGSHGDSFDSGKLSYFALVDKVSFEPGSIQAVPTSDTFKDKAERFGLRNPLAKHFRNTPTLRA